MEVTHRIAGGQKGVQSGGKPSLPVGLDAQKRS
jgi:hypothetical protein